MADPTDLDLDRVAAAFESVVADAVALDRYGVGAWLRERRRADLARAVEHGDHIDDDQPAIPSLRLVMAAREEFMRRADAAEAEVKRLRDLVRRAFVDGYNWSCDGPRDDVRKAWSESIACHEVSRG